MKASRAAALASVTCLVVACRATTASAPTTAAIMPGPGPRIPSRDAEANDACVGCHADVATSWRGSLHARAFVDDVFQRAFAIEPLAFCRDCHAPERGAAKGDDPTREALGVACVTCHDPAGRGEVLAAPRDARQAATRSPHAVRREAAFATAAACVGCHDFPFPDVEARGHDGLRMQRTAGEHLASPFAGASCAACHMPKDASAGGARGHGFSVAGDEALLRDALDAHATRDGERVVVDLAPRRVGHACPTGVLVRRLLVVAEVVGDDGQIFAHAERALGRSFAFVPNAAGAMVQRETRDDRLVGPTRLT
ncbi:MAG TPA: multiheme c-type cytochrome, partial [Labilithrix sp.]|nr:multiheme c-type cytochrome [Labilithrix sp.]